MNKRIIAFGDIHGCFEAAHSAIRLAEELEAQAIFLGDYIDRGPSAAKTLNALNMAKSKYKDWVFLRGNHEQMLIDLIEERADVEELGSVLGMNFSYKQAAKSYDEWLSLSKEERLSLHNFLTETIHYFEDEHHIFVHGLLFENDKSIHEKSNEELLWNYNNEPIWTGKKFIHGHLPIPQIKQTYNGININTQCGYGGFLSGLLIEDEIIKKAYKISEDGKILTDTILLNV